MITPQSQADLDATRQIFREYADGLDVDLCFQDFESELAALPGDYAEPRGALRLAMVESKLAGCCALRPIENADYPDACEMKRLYVRPSFRGLGLGRTLAESVMDAGRVAGYRHLLLDTLDDMGAARPLRRTRLCRGAALLSQPHCRRPLPDGQAVTPGQGCGLSLSL